jgi:hypothetical protein
MEIFPCIFPVIREFLGDELADDWLHRQIKSPAVVWWGFLFGEAGGHEENPSVRKNCREQFFTSDSEPEG